MHCLASPPPRTSALARSRNPWRLLATFTATATALLACTSLVAADWPEWRGPGREDHSPDTGLLKSWPAGGPKKLWLNQDVGLGYAGVSIVGNQLFTMGLRNETELLLALDAATGKERWATPIGDRYENRWGDGPRGTPTVDGDHVYALGGNGTLICARTSDGTVVWKKSFVTDLGGSVPQWGYTESVLIDGDLVIGTPGGDDGTLVALNKTTGAVIWRSKELTDNAQYSSPIVANHGGHRQVIQLVMQRVFGVDITNGKLLWEHDWPGRTAVIPTPIFHDGHVYVTTSYGVGCMLVRLDAQNNVSLVYENKVMKNHHGGVIRVGDYLYGNSDGPGWICQNFKTGEEVWANKSLGKGSIHYADGLFYCLDEGSGDVALVEMSPKGWNEKSRFKLEPQTTRRSPQGRIWTHPVVINGRLYLRDQELLSCYDVRGGS
jgi:outer membrane protein assembly factor BamB